MVILGIDPGTTRIGYAVVKKDGSFFRLETSGLIKHPSSPLLFEQELRTLITSHKPQAATIEKLFFAKNQKTALAVSEMRGVIKFLIQKHDIPVMEPTPLEVKQLITGYGRAEKGQLFRLVTKLLKLTHTPKYDDESDAIAIALCGALLYPSFFRNKAIPHKNA